MITYVNTVLVGKGTPVLADALSAGNAGKYLIRNFDEKVLVGGEGNHKNDMKPYLTTDAELAAAERIQIGLITSKTYSYVAANGSLTTTPIVKWSNIIRKHDVKSLTVAANPDNGSTEFDYTPEKVVIDFNSVDLTTVDDGGYNITLRITYKDLPTRYRKWTESYTYTTVAGDDEEAIVEGFVKEINRNIKRNRIVATAGTSGDAGKLILTAMPYDDDNSVDSINWAGMVRFNANVYYTNPNAAGFASKNKYSFTFTGTAGTSDFITKTEGKMFQGYAKLVRDREAQAMGYEGILNRGEGTWPVIKPEMQTNLSAHYDVVTLEFENMYRAADDIFRKTKQAVEIYDEGAAAETESDAALTIGDALKYFTGDKAVEVEETVDDGQQ